MKQFKNYARLQLGIMVRVQKLTLFLPRDAMH